MNTVGYADTPARHGSGGSAQLRPAIPSILQQSSLLREQSERLNQKLSHLWERLDPQPATPTGKNPESNHNIDANMSAASLNMQWAESAIERLIEKLFN